MLLKKFSFKPVNEKKDATLAFIEKHSYCGEKNEIIISISQTGIAPVYECRCKTCGTKEDVTDYNSF